MMDQSRPRSSQEDIYVWLIRSGRRVMFASLLPNANANAEVCSRTPRCERCWALARVKTWKGSW